MTIKATRQEMLIVTIARQINDGDRLLLGIGVPLVAGLVAKRTHAHNAMLILESGVIDFEPLVPMSTIAETTCFRGYSCSTDLFSLFNTVAHRGFIDKAVLGVGQIDRYGNVNSSFLGRQPTQSQRIAGAGGAPEFMAYAKETILTLRGGSFVERLPYVTSPGFLGGNGQRSESGRYTPNSGPGCLVTPEGIFRFTSDTQELYLDALFPGVGLEDVRKRIPWDIVTAKELKAVSYPTEQELSVLRSFSPQSCFSSGTWKNILRDAQARRPTES